MTQEDEQLLFKDLCARLSYGVKVQYNNEIYNIDYISPLYAEVKLDIPDNYTVGISEIKPYLRPMSSMTEEEDKEWQYYKNAIAKSCDERLEDRISECYDWLNAHHFDYRGRIEKGLALEAPEGMYK